MNTAVASIVLPVGRKEQAALKKLFISGHCCPYSMAMHMRNTMGLKKVKAFEGKERFPVQRRMG